MSWIHVIPGSTSTMFHLLGGFLSAWIRAHMTCKVWGKITILFLNFNGCTVEVWEWKSNFIPQFIMDSITYSCCCVTRPPTSMLPTSYGVHVRVWWTILTGLAISMWRNGMEFNCIFLFPQNNSNWKGLVFVGHQSRQGLPLCITLNAEYRSFASA